MSEVHNEWSVHVHQTLCHNLHFVLRLQTVPEKYDDTDKLQKHPEDTVFPIGDIYTYNLIPFEAEQLALWLKIGG